MIRERPEESDVIGIMPLALTEHQLAEEEAEEVEGHQEPKVPPMHQRRKPPLKPQSRPSKLECDKSMLIIS